MAKKPNAMTLGDDETADSTPTTTTPQAARHEAAAPQSDEASLRSEIAAIKRKCDSLGLHWTEVLREQAVERSRQGDQHRPYCRRHHVLMKAYKTTGGITSYRCPVPECKETAKQAQPRSVIPRDPQECPKCRQRHIEADNAAAAPVYCEVAFSRSTSGTLMLVCPSAGCDFHVLVPRPDIAARSRRMRAQEDLAAP